MTREKRFQQNLEDTKYIDNNFFRFQLSLLCWIYNKEEPSKKTIYSIIYLGNQELETAGTSEGRVGEWMKTE